MAAEHIAGAEVFAVGRIEVDAEAARRPHLVAQVRRQVTEKRQRRPTVVRPIVVLDGHDCRMVSQHSPNGPNLSRRNPPHMRPEPGLLLVRSARVFQPVQVRAKGALRRRDISGRVGTDDVRPPEFL